MYLLMYERVYKSAFYEEDCMLWAALWANISLHAQGSRGRRRAGGYGQILYQKLSALDFFHD